MTCAKFELVIVWFLFSVATNFQTGFPASEDDLVVIDSGSGYVKAGFAGERLNNLFFIRISDYKFQASTFSAKNGALKLLFISFLKLSRPLFFMMVQDY